MSTALKLNVPAQGQKITMPNGKLAVPDQPIIPFIEGDGTGPDIWRASVRVFDAAVQKAYGGKRKIAWMEVLRRREVVRPVQHLAARRDGRRPSATTWSAIKGPLTTPIGGGIRSLNVALRQMLDLYVCLRPVRWFKGVPSPVKTPEKVDMVIFRENTEDIYAGIEFEAGSAGRTRSSSSCSRRRSRSSTRRSASRTPPASASSRSRRKAPSAWSAPRIEYAIANKRKSVTLVHKGNIMKFTEGAFRNWGYALAEREFGDADLHLGAVGAHQGREGREGRERRAGRGDEGRQDPHQGRDRRHHAAAGADAPGRVRRHRHAEPERRLPLRRARRAGRRHRHRAGRQHQLRDRPRRVRGHARHRAEVREPGQGEPGLGDPLRRDDAALHGLDRSGRRDHQGRWTRRSARRPSPTTSRA